MKRTNRTICPRICFGAVLFENNNISKDKYFKQQMLLLDLNKRKKLDGQVQAEQSKVLTRAVTKCGNPNLDKYSGSGINH